MLLANQDYPEHSSSLHKAYFDATKQPDEYLLLDLSKDNGDRLRFRRNIFPTEQNIVYSPPIDDEASEIDLSRSSCTQNGRTKTA